MKKFIKTGSLLIGLLFVFAITNVSHAGYCEDLCTPAVNKMCVARGNVCTDFQKMSTIPPLPQPPPTPAAE